MNKLYPSRINWHNEPSTETPIDEINLNKMDKFCDDIDDRVIEMDSRITDLEDIEPTVLGYAVRAENAATSAESSATNASASEIAAKASEDAALASEGAAKVSENAAKASENAASASETAAKASENAAKASETAAKTSETNAKSSEVAARASKEQAATSATSAGNDALMSESHNHGNTGVRVGEDTDNSMYWSQQSHNYATAASEAAEDAQDALDEVDERIADALGSNIPMAWVDLTTGHLMWQGGSFVFGVNSVGHLMWEVSA